jgi:hypothetical protein
MDQTTFHDSHRKSNARPNELEIDLDAIFSGQPNDEFEFKPLTKGLGFHTEAKRTTGAQVSQQRQIVQPTFSPSHSPASHTALPTMKRIEPVATKGPAIGAKTSQVFMAHFMDQLVILGLFAANLLLVSKVSGIEKQTLFSMLNDTSFLVLSIVIYAIYYVSYFTFNGITGTFGQRLVGIKLMATTGQLDVSKTLTRSLVTLSSLFIFGMPLLFDFHGKLSDTRVVTE